MRMVADENVSSTVIHGLRACGHDVLAVKDLMRGVLDTAIFAQACAAHRLVLTHDKDFGELAFRSGLSAASGVILIRLSGDNPQADNQRILDAIEGRADWMGHFSVITEDRIACGNCPEMPVTSPTVALRETRAGLSRASRGRAGGDTSCGLSRTWRR